MRHEIQALLRQRAIEELISNRHSITMASRKEWLCIYCSSRECNFMHGVTALRRRKGRADAQLRGTVGS